MAPTREPTEGQIRLVVFDAGGVLVRIARTWAEAHTLAGLPLSDVLNNSSFESDRQRISESYQRGECSTEAYCQAIAGISDGVYSPEQVLAVTHAASREEYPGISRVFDALDAAGERRGVATAILSNTHAAHWERLSGSAARASGTAPEYPSVLRVRHLVASHRVGTMKPDASMFRSLEVVTGVRGVSVLFFDDHMENVEGARAAGWYAEVIDPAGDTAEQLMAHLGAYGVI